MRCRAVSWATALLTMSTLGACATRQHQFYTRATYDDSASLDTDAEIAAAIAGIIERGRQIGLTIEEQEPRRLVLTGAVNRAGGRGMTGIEDPRSVVAVATFAATPEGDITYRYQIDIRGKAPDGVDASYEQGVLRGMLLVREAFEVPMDLQTR